MADIKALARLPQIRERFKRAMNMKIVMDKSGHGFQFRLPGFKYDDFDRAGFVSPAKLNKAMESFRFVDQGSFQLERMASSKGLFFLFGNHLTITDLFYRIATVNCPIRFDIRPVGIGKTSVDNYHRMFLDSSSSTSDIKFCVPKDDNLLASRLLRTVFVDRVKQEAMNIPDELRNTVLDAAKYAAEYGAAKKFPEVRLPSLVPDGAFSFEFVPRFSDMDCYFHVNQGSYLEYCLDVAARAAKAGALPNFGNDDICFRKLHTATSLYSSESFPSQGLTASVWEDPSNPAVTLYFVIVRSADKQLVFRSKFVFHPSD